MSSSNTCLNTSSVTPAEVGTFEYEVKWLAAVVGVSAPAEEPWGHLAIAVERFMKGNFAGAAASISTALLRSWAVLEAFSRTEVNRDMLRRPARPGLPATVQEFMFHTESFWEANRKVREFFTKVTTDVHVIEQTRAFHLSSCSLPDKVRDERPVREAVMASVN
jgi:hypothetical protein